MSRVSTKQLVAESGFPEGTGIAVKAGGRLGMAPNVTFGSFIPDVNPIGPAQPAMMLVFDSQRQTLRYTRDTSSGWQDTRLTLPIPNKGRTGKSSPAQTIASNGDSVTWFMWLQDTDVVGPSGWNIVNDVGLGGPVVEFTTPGVWDILWFGHNSRVTSSGAAGVEWEYEMLLNGTRVARTQSYVYPGTDVDGTQPKLSWIGSIAANDRVAVRVRWISGYTGDCDFGFLENAGLVLSRVT